MKLCNTRPVLRPRAIIGVYVVYRFGKEWQLVTATWWGIETVACACAQDKGQRGELQLAEGLEAVFSPPLCVLIADWKAGVYGGPSSCGASSFSFLHLTFSALHFPLRTSGKRKTDS